MTNRFNPRVRTILKYSQEEAERFHSPLIKTEHVMLGILRDGHGRAVDALLRQGVNLDSLRTDLEQTIYSTTSDNWDNVPYNDGGATDTADDDRQHLDRGCDRTLKLSQLEARMMKDSVIAPEHIVLAMLKDDRSVVSRILMQYDVDYNSYYKQVAAMVNIQPEDQNNTRAHGLIDGDKTDKPSAQGNDIPNAYTDSYENMPDEDDDDEDEGGNSSQQGGRATQQRRATEQQASESSTPALDRFGFDMTRAARDGKLDPVVGRQDEIERVTQILSRRKKNNPILIGEPGVGKSAIVEGLAQRIVSKKVSWLLQNKRVISLDMAGLVAGTKYRGQFEERLKSIIKELEENRDIILYIDEIHTMVGAGNAQGSMDAANMLKPALSRGEIQCIGSTTLDEYRKTIEKDGALERRFQKVMVEPTSFDDTLAILQNIRERYEEHHNVRFTDDALQACVQLTDRYVTDRNFPDKAIDAMDEAGSKMHLYSSNVPESLTQLEEQLEEVKRQKNEAILQQSFELAATFRDQERTLTQQLKEAQKQWSEEQFKNRPAVTAENIAECVAMMTGIPVQKVASSEGQKLLALKGVLQSQVIGQDKAIEKLVRAIQRNRIGLKDPQKPIGTFLFLGPTGVGKTYLAKKLAEEMFSAKDSLIRVDMSEFMEKYSVSRLIGAPPGYVGYDEGGQLTERVRRHPYSVVLFDEIEKAHPDVFNLMLQIFDEGHLTDSLGRRVSFKNTIIILTSNVGSRQLKEFGTGIGFSARTDEEVNEVAQSVITKALQKTFAPEFINRIDDIIHFSQLSRDDIHRIVSLELRGVIGRIEELGYPVSITDAAMDFLGQKGYDKQYGARPLKRAVQQYVEDILCEELLSHQGDAHIRFVIDKDPEADSTKVVVESIEDQIPATNEADVSHAMASTDEVPATEVTDMTPDDVK